MNTNNRFNSMQFYPDYIKRAMDCTVAIILLIILLPLLLGLGILLVLILRGNPFFFQRRPGKNGVVFWLFKFRTMNNQRDATNQLLPDHERLTTVGKMMRASSLDELPQLFNVLIGDMSLVGPRPLLVDYLPLYTKEQNRRHLVRPGITGWAQVNGRNNITWEKRFELDTWYVDHLSFKLDLYICWLTILKVLRRKDISQQGHATMPFFNGNKIV